MGEIKSVKVDNWGVFFLQKLQNFFNKTDYCDLTLQFNDNSQLKVHRLVLNACTDYFNILEQTCEMIDDVLIMPPELQADVVVPIVNFMYTGTLEFELKMYGRLLKTAKDMNMTVLLKLLEAHRRTMETNKQQTLNKMAPKTLRRIALMPTTSKSVEDRSFTNQGTSTTPQRRTQIANAPQYKTLQIKPVAANIFPRNLPEPAQIVTKYPHTKTPVKGPSRFECNDDTLPPETFEKSFDNISYESKPLICTEETDPYDYDNLIRKHETYASPFEQLRRGYTNNNNKRPSSSVSSYESPPEKKPNIQDVKEYAEQQRVRKQIAEEFGDDHEYDEMLDDEFHNDDDDDEYIPPQSIRRQIAKQQQQQAQTAKVNQPSKITLKKEGSPRPTIVVKDTTSTNVNHAKIISEVLRKYPHLVKNNKNIKLKIMPQSSNAQKIVIKRESSEAAGESSSSSVQQMKSHAITSNIITKQATPSTSTSNQPAAISGVTQPRRIDSKTMHALIAMGAENRTGPWLCLRCGVNGRPISIPSYRGFRRHLINVHKEKIDPRLCEHCGWRSTNNKELAHHMLVEHSIRTSQFNFPKCQVCGEILIDQAALTEHHNEKHAVIKKEKQTCIYCNRTFTEELHLYTHMKAFHKERAIEDGVWDFSDDETTSEVQAIQDNKIKIISDISLPKNLPIIQSRGVPATATTLGLDPVSEATVASDNVRVVGSTTADNSHMLVNEYMGTDSSQGPKFVNAEGNEMDLTPAQREEIMSQLDQQHDGIVMVLNEEPFGAASVAENVTENVTGSVATEQISENSMFIVCGQDAETVSEPSMTATLDREKSKSKDPLEWAGEDASSEGKEEKNEKKEEEDNKSEKSDSGKDEKKSYEEEESKSDEIEKDESKKDKPKDSLEMKLRLLTDWSDDDDEEQEEEHSESLNTSKEEEQIIEKEESGKEESSKEESGKEEILFETIARVSEDSEASKKNADEKSDVEECGAAEEEKPEEKFDDIERELEKVHTDEEKKNGDEQISSEKEEDQEEVQDDTEMNEKDDTLDEKNTSDKEPEVEEKTEKAESPPSRECNKKVEKDNGNLITKAELRNIMSDWVDDDDDDEM